MPNCKPPDTTPADNESLKSLNGKEPNAVPAPDKIELVAKGLRPKPKPAGRSGPAIAGKAIEATAGIIFSGLNIFLTEALTVSNTSPKKYSGNPVSGLIDIRPDC